MNPNTPTAMQAKAGGSSGSVSVPRRAVGSSSLTESLLPRSDVRPEDVLAEIRSLLEENHIVPARRMAAAAVRRFPDDSELRNAHRILNQGTATPAGGPEPGTDQEFAWLRHPPQSARGKWVALSGSEMVAAADDLVELEKTLSARSFQDRALIHYID